MTDGDESGTQYATEGFTYHNGLEDKRFKQEAQTVRVRAQRTRNKQPPIHTHT